MVVRIDQSRQQCQVAEVVGGSHSGAARVTLMIRPPDTVTSGFSIEPPLPSSTGRRGS
jgi:hypothetical protein